MLPARRPGSLEYVESELDQPAIKPKSIAGSEIRSTALNSEPLVSVMTPVYNGERYLAECIESVLAQTYRNWEYVIVDNCSTDRSFEIARLYAEKSPRVRLHRNDCYLGMFQNWNHALEKISPESKYCKIVHADDWIFPECISKMVECAEANPSVGIVGAYRLEEDKVTCGGLPYTDAVFSGREICRMHLLDENHLFGFGSPTNTMIRSDLIRNRRPFYNESNFHSDTEACYDLLAESDFGFVHQILTFTRRSNEANTMFARRMNTFIISSIADLQKFGPMYLTRRELDRLLARKLKEYYRYLGVSVFHRKGKGFWEYHRKALAELGYPMNWIRLFMTSAFEVFNYFLESVKLR